MVQKDSAIIDFSTFELLDIRVGVICAVEKAEGCKAPSYKLQIDFGREIGAKRSVAQATNYEPDELLGRQILAVVNLKPRQIGKHISEVLLLGVPTLERGTALVVPEMTALIGGRLF